MNAGETAWLLVCTALVMLMVPESVVTPSTWHFIC